VGIFSGTSAEFLPANIVQVNLIPKIGKLLRLLKEG
jgi:hypothetical protein